MESDNDLVLLRLQTYLFTVSVQRFILYVTNNFSCSFVLPFAPNPTGATDTDSPTTLSVTNTGFPRVGETKKIKDLCSDFKDPFYTMFGIVIHF